MEIEEQKPRFTQISIIGFLKEEPPKKEEFFPIDVTREPKPVVKKCRGRPRKYDISKPTNPTIPKKIEEVIEEEREENEGKIDERKLDISEAKRKIYKKISFQKKLSLINEYDNFKRTIPKKNGKPVSFIEFCHQIGESYGIIWSTVKTICVNYEKTPAIKTQLEVLCSTKKGGEKTGQALRREARLSYDKELDLEIADWIYCSMDLGYILTRESIRERAIELIKPTNPEFKASEGWLLHFLERHNFSFRKLNGKSAIQSSQFDDLATKLRNAVQDVIKKFNIKSSMVINMDETPYFWEYLPRKILTAKMSKEAASWKRNYHNARSTLVLAATAAGTLLKPALILKRKSSYTLKCQNGMGMLMMNSQNGWMNEDLMLTWLKEILIPYVQDNDCILLWDSYEAHTSEKVLNFLKDYPKIHLGVIVGGTTSKNQPLDININKKFKTICKKKSIEHANSTLMALNKMNALGQQKAFVSQRLVKGKQFLTLKNLLIH